MSSYQGGRGGDGMTNKFADPNYSSVDQSDRTVPVNLRQTGRPDIELLISTRARKSPYWHLAIEAGCRRAEVYNRMYLPRGYVPEGEVYLKNSSIHAERMWDAILGAGEKYGL